MLVDLNLKNGVYWHVSVVAKGWFRHSRLKCKYNRPLGIVHTKNEILSSVTKPSNCSKPVWLSFSCWTKKKIFWRMLVTKQLTVATDFHSTFYCSILWKAMATVNSLVTNILQNIFFCAQQKKLLWVWSNLSVRKWWQNSHFWVNYSFKLIFHCQNEEETLEGKSSSESTEHTCFSRVFDGLQLFVLGNYIVLLKICHCRKESLK